MTLKMGTLAKGSRRNFSHSEFESQALGTEFLCAIVSVFLIAVTGSSHTMWRVQYLSSAALCCFLAPVAELWCWCALQLEHKGTES